MAPHRARAVRTAAGNTGVPAPTKTFWTATAQRQVQHRAWCRHTRGVCTHACLTQQSSHDIMRTHVHSTCALWYAQVCVPPSLPATQQCPWAGQGSKASSYAVASRPATSCHAWLLSLPGHPSPAGHTPCCTLAGLAPCPAAPQQQQLTPQLGFPCTQTVEVQLQRS